MKDAIASVEDYFRTNASNCIFIAAFYGHAFNPEKFLEKFSYTELKLYYTFIR